MIANSMRRPIGQASVEKLKAVSLLQATAQQGMLVIAFFQRACQLGRKEVPQLKNS
jgi:hypothetical protein